MGLPSSSTLKSGEKQSNHLAEDSVNIAKGLSRTLQSSTQI